MRRDVTVSKSKKINWKVKVFLSLWSKCSCAQIYEFQYYTLPVGYLIEWPKTIFIYYIVLLLIVRLINQGSYFGTFFLHTIHNRSLLRHSGRLQKCQNHYIYSHWSFPGKNILQELLSRELTTTRHVSFIQNLDNLDTYLYSDRQSSNFLTNEIQSNLNLLRNGSYAAKSIECSNYKQDRTFSS